MDRVENIQKKSGGDDYDARNHYLSSSSSATTSNRGDGASMIPTTATLSARTPPKPPRPSSLRTTPASQGTPSSSPFTTSTTRASSSLNFQDDTKKKSSSSTSTPPSKRRLFPSSPASASSASSSSSMIMLLPPSPSHHPNYTQDGGASLFQDIATQFHHAHKAWSADNPEMALSYLERSLTMLLFCSSSTPAETTSSVSEASCWSLLLGSSGPLPEQEQKGQHQLAMLFSQTYYWMGYIFLYSSRRDGVVQKPYHHQTATNIRKAIKSFLKTIRISRRTSSYGGDGDDKDGEHSFKDAAFKMLETAVSKLFLLLKLPSSVSSASALSKQLTQLGLDTSLLLRPGEDDGYGNETDDEEQDEKKHTIKIDYIQSLQESIQMEQRGDDILLSILSREREAKGGKTNDSHSSSFAYDNALQYYQKSLEDFPDPDHGRVMAKIAYCYDQQIGSSASILGGDDDDGENMEELAVLWYRRALKAFCSTGISTSTGLLGGLTLMMKPATGASTTVTASGSSHSRVGSDNGSITSFSSSSSYSSNDVEWTMQRLVDILSKNPSSSPTSSLATTATTKIKEEWYQNAACDSALLEWEADQLQQELILLQRHEATEDDGDDDDDDDDDKNEILRQLAMQKYHGALLLEGRVWGSKHLVCVHLKKQIQNLLEMRKQKMATPTASPTKFASDAAKAPEGQRSKTSNEVGIYPAQNTLHRLLQMSRTCENAKQSLYRQRLIAEQSAKNRLSASQQSQNENLPVSSSPASSTIEMEEIESDMQEFNLCKKRCVKAKSLVVLLDSTIGEALSMTRKMKVTESSIKSDKRSDKWEEHEVERSTAMVARCDESTAGSSTEFTTAVASSPSTTSDMHDDANQVSTVGKSMDLSNLSDRTKWFVAQCRILNDIKEGHDQTLTELKKLGARIEHIYVQSQLLVETKSRLAHECKQKRTYLTKRKQVLNDAADELSIQSKELQSRISELYAQMNDLKAAAAAAKPVIPRSLSPFKRRSRAVEQARHDNDTAKNELEMRSLQDEYSSTEGRLKIVNERIDSLGVKEREILARIEDSEDVFTDAESQLDQARKEVSSIKSSYVALSSHIKRLRTSKLAAEALQGEAQKELRYLRQEEGLDVDTSDGILELQEQMVVAATNGGSDRLLTEALECVSKLKAGLERLNVRTSELRAEQSGKTRQTKAMEKMKIHMDMALFKANEGLDASRAECEAILGRFSRIERREKQLKEQLQRFEGGINTITAEALAEGTVSTASPRTEVENGKVTTSLQDLQDAEKNAIEIQAARAALAARSHELELAHVQCDMRLQQALDQIRTLEKLAAEMETKMKQRIETRDSLRSKLQNAGSGVAGGASGGQTATFDMTSKLLAGAMANFSTDGSDSSIATDDISIRSGETMSVLEGTLPLEGALPETITMDQEGEEVLTNQVGELDGEIERLQFERDALHKKIRDTQQIVTISSIDKKSLEADKSELSSELAMLENGTHIAGSNNGGVSKQSMTGIRDTQILAAELEGKLRASEIELDLIRRELENSHSLIVENETASDSVRKLISDSLEASGSLTENLRSMSNSHASLNKAKEPSEDPRSATTVDHLDSLKHEMKTIVIAKDFLALIISRLADYTTMDLSVPVKAAEGAMDTHLVEEAKRMLKVAGLRVLKLAIEKQLQSAFQRFKKLSLQKSEEQTRLFKLSTHIHDIEEARARVANEYSKSKDALLEAGNNARALKAALTEKEEQLQVLEAASGQLKKMKADKDASRGSVGHLMASQSVLVTRWEECKADVTRYHSELSLSSKVVAGLELSDKRVKKQKIQVDKQLATMMSRKEVIEASLREISQELVSVEKGRESLPFQLAECLKELNKSILELEEQSQLVAKKGEEVENLKSLIEGYEDAGGAGYRIGLVYEVQLQSAEKDIFHLKSEFKRIKRKKTYVGSTCLMLKLQNRIALKYAEETSKELNEAGEKRLSVKNRYEELQKFFSSLENLHGALKTKLHLVHDAPEGTIVSTTASSFHSFVDETSRNLSLYRKQAQASPAMAEKLADARGETESSGMLENNAQSVQCVYQFKSVSYLVRRPFCMNGREDSLFQGASPLDTNSYHEKANVQDPSTIEIMAKISHDGSHFFLSGRSAVRYKGKDGLWESAGDTDTLDKPLGWVSYRNAKGDLDYYSLDDILESTRVYRQHYCESFLLQARRHKPMDDNKWILLFHRIRTDILFLNCFREELYTLNEVLLVGAVVALVLSMSLSAFAQAIVDGLVTRFM